MEYNLFNEFVQTFLVDRKDFLSDNGKIVLSREALDECINRFIVNFIGGSDQNFGDKLRQQFKDASSEAKIVFAHASWLYVHSSKAMRALGKEKAVMISLLDLPGYQIRKDIFLDKGGIADPGTAYNTQKPANLRFIIYMFKWIKGSQAGIRKESVIKAVTAACLYGVYGQEKVLIDAFGKDQTQQIKKDYQLINLGSGNMPRLGIYNFLLNLCNPDYYERIVSFRDKELIADRLYMPEYGSKQGLNIDDQIYMIKQHLKVQYPDIDPKYLLHDERIKSLWQSKKLTTENYWIFQANPRLYDLIGALREDKVSKWKVTTHLDKIHIGDKVILWVTGQDAGCYALAEVTGELDMLAKDEEEKDFYKDESYAQAQPRVGISVTHNMYEKPILRSQIAGIKELANLKASIQGTNFKATKEQYNALLSLVGNASPTQPLRAPMPAPPQTTQYPLNQILYGPPGTGKTYNTVDRALEIIGIDLSGKSRTDIKKEFDAKAKDGQIVFTAFHQSMCYEDFIEGIKPITNEDQGNSLTYEVVPGIFKRLCDKAALSDDNNFEQSYDRLTNDLESVDPYMKVKTRTGAEFGISLNSNNNLNLYLGQGFNSNGSLTKDTMIAHILGKTTPKFFRGYYLGVFDLMRAKYGLKTNVNLKENYVLIIDEINRGNVSQIFGELITLIESDKRMGMPEALEVTLPYSKSKFGVPPNLYIIGTMNTADRSVEALDIALRRRFSFQEMPPLYSVLDANGVDLLDLAIVTGIQLKSILRTINRRIEKLLDKDHQIGHSYFLSVTDLQGLRDVFRDKIIPLLEEYFYGDPGKIGLVLGSGFVKIKDMGTAQDFFADMDYDDLDNLSERAVYDIQVPVDDEDFKAALKLMKIKDEQN